jgi:riboflavin biosynthesis pyrimidine reductase
LGAADLRRLGDAGSRTVRELVASLGLGEGAGPRPPAGRPRVVADMVVTVDGRAAVSGTSVALGHPADRALLRELRTAADAILVGASTLRAERYANLLDEEQRARRVAAGRPPHPLVVTVSRRLDVVTAEIPLFAEEGVPIAVFAQGDGGSLPDVAADAEVVRLEALTLTAVLELLGARGIRGVLCEGGPTLLRRLVGEGAVDDLLLTVAPLLAAGDAPSILEGDVLDGPARLALLDVHRADDHAFLHYGLTSR